MRTSDICQCAWIRSSLHVETALRMLGWIVSQFTGTMRHGHEVSVYSIGSYPAIAYCATRVCTTIINLRKLKGLACHYDVGNNAWFSYCYGLA